MFSGKTSDSSPTGVDDNDNYEYGNSQERATQLYSDIGNGTKDAAVNMAVDYSIGKAFSIFGVVGKLFGKEADELIRVRHYTNRKGINGIEETGEILASDSNRVYVELANKKALSSLEAETKYGLKQGKGRDYVEFDIQKSKVEPKPNPAYGKIELTIRGGVDELINAIFVKRK